MEEARLRIAVARLPAFDGSWPIELVELWFRYYFELLEAAEALSARTEG